MRQLSLALVLLSSLIGASDSTAQELPAPERAAVYLQLEGVNAFQLTEGHDGEHSVGFQARVGLRPAARMGFDLSYQRQADNNVTVGSPAQSAKVRLTTQVYALNVKVFLLTGRVQPYVSAGPAAAFLSLKEVQFAGASFKVANRSGFALRFGTGVDVFITDNLVGVAELGYAHGLAHQVDGFRQLGVHWGLQYRFD